MASYDRRAVARRRAWGRGPMILRFDSLEGRQLLSSTPSKVDLVASQFTTVHTAYWGDQIVATGTIANRGASTTRVPVEVDIYASSKPNINASSGVTKFLGSVVVPSGLPHNGIYNFNQLVTLPVASTTASSSLASQQLYLALNVDPNNAANESTMADKSARGLGIDESGVVVSQRMPAVLEGTAFSIGAVSTSQPGIFSWGDTFNVTEQIKNVGLGNAPATRARIVLTPAGATPGAYNDVTIGTINVPAIPAFGTANVVQQVVLPPFEPSTLGTATQFTVSVVQDADFLTQPIYPQVASQGAGLDQGALGISPGPFAGVLQPPTPDLAPTTVQVSQTSLTWGQQFQVAALVQNISNVPAGPFTVRFVAAGASGDLSHGIFLGDVQVPGLPANGATNVLTTVQLPSILPYGDTVASPAYSQIYAITDPEDVLNETLRTNNMASSAPVLLQVVGSNGASTNVPTYPQDVFTSATLEAQAARQIALNQQVNLGTPKPAAAIVKKSHKVNLLASISESITKFTVNEIKGIPKGINSALKNISASSSSNSSKATTTTSASTATQTTTTVAAASSVGSTTSGGSGGFGATPVNSSTAV